MDFGLRGRKALVCAASKGLGKGCAEQLAGEGVALTLVARGQVPLEETARDIREAYGVSVTTVAADITTPEGRTAALAACPSPDILINNAGGPPPGDFRDWDRDIWIRALDANMLTPIELIKATVDGMIERRFGRIVNITSGAVKAPIETLGLSNGVRAGLTGFVAGLARKTVEFNVTINNLLPGPAPLTRSACAPISVLWPRRVGKASRRLTTPGVWRTRPSASGPPRNSVPLAPTFAVPRPDSSPGRIFSWTEVLIRAHFELV